MELDWTYPMKFSYAHSQDYYFRQLVWNYMLIAFTYRQAFDERTRQVRKLSAEVTMLQRKQHNNRT